ncbi:gametogenetin-binding protein 1-like isoform X3 [Pseudorca crassidens]|uniref:gametogenetin-binding protein 1-like isoform X3 n=1 Tax=Pseudorca crassidens TaxID=82174 RepID=UPI00352DC8F7
MEAPASSPRSRILGHSSMFRFFRSLVGSKGSPKSSDKALLGGQSCPFREQNATPLMTDHQGGAGRESRSPATLPYTFSVALPQPDPSGLGLGDTGPQTPTPVEVLRVLAQGVEVKPVLPRGSQEVLGNLSELEEREEEQTEAAGDTGTSDRGHFAQALAVEQGCLQRAMGPLDISPETFTGEEKKERLLDGDLRLASSQVGATPWNRLLSLYKQLQKSAPAKARPHPPHLLSHGHTLRSLSRKACPVRRKAGKRKQRGTAHSSSVSQALPPSSRRCIRLLGRQIQFRGVVVKEASGSATGVPPLGDGWPRGPEAADPARDHPGGGRRRGCPETPS